MSHEVGERGVSGLVNNAGKVTLAPVEFMPLATFEDQLQVRGESVCAWIRRRGGGRGGVRKWAER